MHPAAQSWGRVLLGTARVAGSGRGRFLQESAGVGFNVLVGPVEDSECCFGGVHVWY